MRDLPFSSLRKLSIKKLNIRLNKIGKQIMKLDPSERRNVFNPKMNKLMGMNTDCLKILKEKYYKYKKYNKGNI